MRVKVTEYLREDGSSPYAEWFARLDPVAAAKVVVAVVRMEQGNLSNVKWFRGIGEFRIDWGPGYRIYIGKEGDKLILLLGGGTKRSQPKDVDRAVALWEEYKTLKSRGNKRNR